jgi:hypothetical protein
MTDNAMGFWTISADNPGRRVWQGPFSWETQEGVSKIEWLYGRMHRVTDAISPDGTLLALLYSGQDRPEFDFYHKLSDGTCEYGSIVVGGAGVEFTPTDVQVGPCDYMLSDMSSLIESLNSDKQFIKLLKSDHSFASDVYHALADNIWFREDPFSIICYPSVDAAMIVAALRGKRELSTEFYPGTNEGSVTPLVRTRLSALGWGLLDNISDSARSNIKSLVFDTIDAAPDMILSTRFWSSSPLFGSKELVLYLENYITEISKFDHSIEGRVILPAVLVRTFIRHSVFVGRIPRDLVNSLYESLDIFSAGEMGDFLHKIRENIKSGRIRFADEIKAVIVELTD